MAHVCGKLAPELSFASGVDVLHPWNIYYSMTRRRRGKVTGATLRTTVSRVRTRPGDLSVRTARAKMHREMRAHLFLFRAVISIRGRCVTIAARGIRAEKASNLQTEPPENHPTHQPARLPPSPLNANGGCHFSQLSFVCFIFLDMSGPRITFVHNARLWCHRMPRRKSTVLNHSRRRL